MNERANKVNVNFSRSICDFLAHHKLSVFGGALRSSCALTDEQEEFRKREAGAPGQDHSGQESGRQSWNKEL